ncbi:hypothetical protein ACFCQI_01775 [Rhodanobacter sp. FW102-FHT14D06]|uniref:Uncharacterized protein n=2 Tax=unclassified Rhodanobacter TaxID=2621553 RepID=A0AB74US96_9GAMM
MSAPVNVLAVLQYHAIGLRDAPWLTRKQAGQVADELAKASAAVAELIEAATLGLQYVNDFNSAYGSTELDDVAGRIRTALANVGGAA